MAKTLADELTNNLRVSVTGYLGEAQVERLEQHGEKVLAKLELQLALRKAVAMVRSLNPHVVTMDLLMPLLSAKIIQLRSSENTRDRSSSCWCEYRQIRAICTKLLAYCDSASSSQCDNHGTFGMNELGYYIREHC